MNFLSESKNKSVHEKFSLSEGRGGGAEGEGLNCPGKSEV